MKREIDFIKIEELPKKFPAIEFPDYQREPNVWGLDQKQRLIDSIFREFDISAIYMYVQDNGSWECIDGRQRLNAIMSFLGHNEKDEDHNGFRTKFDNEVSKVVDPRLAVLDGKSWERLHQISSETPNIGSELAAFEQYKITVVTLEASQSVDEFNLQFLRLNLGSLINSGEKLHAMSGALRNEIFGAKGVEGSGLGKHAFLKRAQVPTRRYAVEQIAAQLVLQAGSYQEKGEFARARYLDLQRLFKDNVTLTDELALVIREVRGTLDVLEQDGGAWVGVLRNRAFTVSIILLAWIEYRVNSELDASKFAAFAGEFANALAEKAKEMRMLSADVRKTHGYLIDFQRHITQAAVERPAVAARHKELARQWEFFELNGSIMP